MINFRVKNKVFIVVFAVVVAVVLASGSFAALNVTHSLGSSGSVATSPGLDVYVDEACSVSLSRFDWGNVDAGETMSQVFYVKNTGTGDLVLSMVVDSWVPVSASDYINLSWNLEGYRLGYGQAAKVELSLAVERGASALSFTNNVVLRGIQ